MSVGFELQPDSVNGPEALPERVKTAAPGMAVPLGWLVRPATTYCLIVLLLPLLAVPAFIALGRSDFFMRHGASVWVQANDDIFSEKHQHCDVLVYGDSTAMTGIDPQIVDRDTGFHTCNIAVTNAVLAVTGNLTLDRFLAQNDHPKLLIVQLSPDDFQRENLVWSHTIYAEGLLELLRHGSPGESRRVLMTHPHEAVAFAGYAAGYSAFYAIKDAWFRTTHIRAEEDTVQVHNGFFTPPAPARKYCETTSRMRSPEDSFARGLTSEFHSRYADRSSVVLVDVAPIPSCDENLDVYSQQLNGVTSNTLQALPIQLFNDGRHYTAFGSRVVSNMIARQVNETVMKNPELDDRPPADTTIATLQAASLER